MAFVYIDGQGYRVDDRHNLLHVCLSLGLDLPYFCWHPALGSVGACRQCAVKQFRDEQDQTGRVVMACMTPAADGTRIAVQDHDAQAMRASVIEWLMVNHPHDCPVCEEGGECHLQDMTVMTGHSYRRHRFNKRTFRNQNLGPFINHEMNRCITCYRCVRFYRDYAGGQDLHALGSHNHVYFGRHQEGVLENEFSGNLVEVCPTGVFTDKTFAEHYTRKWDLQSAPSVCVHCGLGCNVSPNERYGRLRRIVNRYNGAVNGYFLCDRGRFGYQFVNSEHRARQPMLRKARHLAPTPCTQEVSLQTLGPLLTSASTVLGIGSPRASVEANFALRALVGEEHFYSGVSSTECRLLMTSLQILRQGPARIPSLRDVERADAVLVLGEDVPNIAPRLALALRQSARQRAWQMADTLGIPRWQDSSVRDATGRQKSPMFIAVPHATRLDDLACETFHAAPNDLARIAFAVAHHLDPEAPKVADLSQSERALAIRIAKSLAEAERPLVVSGAGCGSEAVLQGAANVAWALCRKQAQPADLCLPVPECNSLGLALLGGGPLEQALAHCAEGKVDVLLVLENDLYRRADRTAVENALTGVKHVVVLDHLLHETASQADSLLPAATFAEGNGTLVSNEGRAQRFLQVFQPQGAIQPSWRWLRDLGRAAGREQAIDWHNLDAIGAACAETLPHLAPMVHTAPAAEFRIAGMQVQRAPHRYSGRTAMNAHASVHEPSPAGDPDSPLSLSMEGYYGGRIPASVIPYFWAPAWNSVQSVNKFQDEVGGPLREGDPGRRLIEPARHASIDYFRAIPAAFEPATERWLLVPCHQIFASEELSRYAPAVAQRAPVAHVSLNREDAARLDIASEDSVKVTLGSSRTIRLPLELQDALPRGVAGLPAHLPGLEGIEWPVWATLSRSTPQ
jgi:NADH-quinone oxidoreductase subunit G